MYSRKLSAERGSRGGFYNQSPPPGYGGTAFMPKAEPFAEPSAGTASGQTSAADAEEALARKRGDRAPEMNKGKEALRDGIDAFDRIISLLGSRVKKEPREFSFAGAPGEKAGEGADIFLSSPQNSTGGPGAEEAGFHGKAGFSGGGRSAYGEKAEAPRSSAFIPRENHTSARRGGTGVEQSSSPSFSEISAILRGLAADKSRRCAECGNAAMNNTALSDTARRSSGEGVYSKGRAARSPGSAEGFAESGAGYKGANENSGGAESEGLDPEGLVKSFFRTRYTIEELLIMGISLLLASGQAEDETLLIFGLLMLLSDENGKDDIG